MELPHLLPKSWYYICKADKPLPDAGRILFQELLFTRLMGFQLNQKAGGDYGRCRKCYCSALVRGLVWCMSCWGWRQRKSSILQWLQRLCFSLPPHPPTRLLQWQVFCVTVSAFNGVAYLWYKSTKPQMFKVEIKFETAIFWCIWWMPDIRKHRVLQIKYLAASALALKQLPAAPGLSFLVFTRV